MNVLILIIYNLALVPLLAYNLGQLNLLLIYVRTGRQRRAAKPVLLTDLPRVTIQLPIYNELYVVERLIDAVTALRYPTDKIDIQVLDDSTDETTALIAQKVTYYQQQGVSITHVRRPTRTGYKAGALAYGLLQAKGEFVAIFDADFVPNPDFLLQTIGHFTDPAIGLVQTRWTHLNEGYSLLTQLQGFGLDAHFLVEQSARHVAGFFLNFNGTAGVWRKTAISDAGGWSHDTLTEDLDLSYRAQLRGWQFVYRDDVNSPAELPVTMDAFRSQQYRWMKGAAECARKLVWPVLTAKNASLNRRIHGLFHLISSTMFALILLFSVLTVPLLVIRLHHPNWQWGYWLPDFFQISFFIALFFYGVPFWRVTTERGKPLGLLRFLWYFPLYVALMFGISLHNTIAVVEGFMGRKTPFIRTPKFNINQATDQWRGNIYTRPRIGLITVLEGLMILYFLGAIGLGYYLNDHRLLLFHSILAIGYGLVFGYSLMHHGVGRRLPPNATTRPANELQATTA